ncbi:hypothetical protein Gpo141_00012026 [Globisporangium polare]
MSGGNPFKRFAFGAAAPATETLGSEAATTPAQLKRARRERAQRTPAAADQTPRIKSERRGNADELVLVKHEPQDDAVELLKPEGGGCDGDEKSKGDTALLQEHRVPAEHGNADDGDEEVGRDRRLVLLTRLFRARETMVTPIDEYGTQACVAPHAKVERNRRFHILVGALLSSQTKDQFTHAAMCRLHEQLRSPDGTNDDSDSEGLTIAKVLTTSEGTLDALINSVGFHRKKAQQLKQIAETLDAGFEGDVPQSYAELVKLPGVGPKIARVVLLLAWNQVDGLIVDTHVHRLAQRLGWTLDGVPGSLRKSGPEAIATPEDTRKSLEGWIPREHWGKFSLAVVGFGQNVCTAVNPKCASCPLADLCPSAFRMTSATKSKSTKRRS